VHTLVEKKKGAIKMVETNFNTIGCRIIYLNHHISVALLQRTQGRTTQRELSLP
jgi:RES domain-containing protein